MKSQILKIIFLIVLKLLIFSTFISQNNSIAQSNKEIDELYGLFSKNVTVKYSLNCEYKSEYQLLSDLLFTGYKNFISPFDSQSCTFYPSCSVYAIESIEKKGFIIGILNSSDRLMRCNGLSPELYPNYKNSKFLFDPVK